jgi:hypothetical protein
MLFEVMVEAEAEDQQQSNNNKQQNSGICYKRAAQTAARTCRQ